LRESARTNDVHNSHQDVCQQIKQIDKELRALQVCSWRTLRVQCTSSQFSVPGPTRQPGPGILAGRGQTAGGAARRRSQTEGGCNAAVCQGRTGPAGGAGPDVVLSHCTGVAIKPPPAVVRSGSWLWPPTQQRTWASRITSSQKLCVQDALLSSNHDECRVSRSRSWQM
jgi:hypothetical protein